MGLFLNFIKFLAILNISLLLIFLYSNEKKLAYIAIQESLSTV